MVDCVDEWFLVSDDMDSGIIEVARQFVARSKVCQAPPDAVVWSSRYSVDQYSVTRRQLVLPRTLGGRLRPEEWAPLIASLLLRRYSRRVRRVLLRGLILPIGLLVILISSVVAFFNVTNSPNLTELGFFIAYIYVVIGIDVFAVLRTIPKYSRDAWLVADQETARFYGKDFFLKVLTKISGDSGLMKSRRNESQFARWPSLSRRIENLSLDASVAKPAA